MIDSKPAFSTSAAAALLLLLLRGHFRTPRLRCFFFLVLKVDFLPMVGVLINGHPELLVGCDEGRSKSWRHSGWCSIRGRGCIRSRGRIGHCRRRIRRWCC